MPRAQWLISMLIPVLVSRTISFMAEYRCFSGFNHGFHLESEIALQVVDLVFELQHRLLLRINARLPAFAQQLVEFLLLLKEEDGILLPLVIVKYGSQYLIVLAVSGSHRAHRPLAQAMHPGAHGSQFAAFAVASFLLFNLAHISCLLIFFIVDFPPLFAAPRNKPLFMPV